MTAFAGPRIATRHTTTRVARPTSFSNLRDSLQGLRGAVRSATESRGSDYADALFLGRN